MSPEFDVLDQLEGGPLSYAIIEKIFEGDRRRALRCLSEMSKEGLIALTVDETEVPPWQLAEWLRAPFVPTAEANLANCTLRLTHSGLRWIAYGEGRQ